MCFPGGLEGKESAWSTGDLSSIPGLGRSSGEGNGNPLQYLLGESHGQRSLMGYHPWSHKESDMTEHRITPAKPTMVQLPEESLPHVNLITPLSCTDFFTGSLDGPPVCQCTWGSYASALFCTDKLSCYCHSVEQKQKSCSRHSHPHLSEFLKLTSLFRAVIG